VVPKEGEIPAHSSYVVITTALPFNYHPLEQKDDKFLIIVSNNYFNALGSFIIIILDLQIQRLQFVQRCRPKVG